ncbi:DUF2164 domain-containing protein [Gracilibacillus xinjiangensis]|uniref:DUF2164 domain-containing protein n=1 Tax=Gracilibacillus xinjiangensis TaxID=1193282 RepID=A0ABV8WRD4_9BACI
MDLPFQLTKEKREEFIHLLQDYFFNERGESIGNLEAGFILDFIIKELSPTFYNIGIRDAHTFLNDKLEDLFELEKH